MSLFICAVCSKPVSILYPSSFQRGGHICISCLGVVYRHPSSIPGNKTQPKGAQKMAIKCRIWWDLNTQAYVVNSAFNEKLVDGLKHVIPSSDREWDKQSKFWYLKEPYGLVMKQVAETVFGVGSVSFTSKTAAEQAATQQHNAYIPPISSSITQLDRAIINFIRALPYDAAKHAYRHAANSLHPDKGGSLDKMTELNMLWSQIEREVYHK